jgi:glycosyltransferase involved in cell wall biosynthesis
MASLSEKSCLIFNNYPLKITDGGPSGFLANNLAGATGQHWKMNEVHAIQSGSNPFVARLRARSTAFDARLAFRHSGLPKGGWLRNQVLSARRSYRAESASDYPAVWFHDVYSAFACHDLLPPDQDVILQPHCPELPSQEVTKSAGMAEDVGWMQTAEQFAFGRANLVVLPNEYVKSIYEPLLSHGKRVGYLLSGCSDPVVRYILPLDPRNVYFLFLGRRMAIKGFDVVLKAFQMAFEVDPRLRLLLVGGGESVTAPGIIDIGFSSEPAAWMASCDYFISANRQSYLDLSLMEALSTGTPSIVCCTGGHRQLLEVQSPGIIPLGDPDAKSLSEALLRHKIKRAENPEAVSGNSKLFHGMFSASQYRARLDRFLTNYFSDRGSKEVAATEIARALGVSARVADS